MKVISVPQIQIEKKEGYVIVTINRPEKKNALSLDVLRSIETALNELKGTKAVIFTGSGSFFSAGGDLGVMYSLDRSQGTEFSKIGNDIMDKIEEFEGVTIAAIEGGAYGGGLELALSCDVRVASQDSKLGLTEVNLGLFPGWGGMKRLRKAVGYSMAKYLALTGSVITGNDAYKIGLVNVLCDHPLRCAEELASSLSSKSLESFKSIKHLISKDPYDSSEESKMFGEILWSDQARTALSKFLKLK
ncbi:MAG: enoyl-CoA hydratase/isomerase family protein [Thermoplasmatales archaeon]